jgi:hypothetical protein
MKYRRFQMRVSVGRSAQSTIAFGFVSGNDLDGDLSFSSALGGSDAGGGS